MRSADSDAKRGNSPWDAASWDVVVEEGDVVIVGSDGLFDNLAEKKILDATDAFLRRSQDSIMQGVYSPSSDERCAPGTSQEQGPS